MRSVTSALGWIQVAGVLSERVRYGDSLGAASFDSLGDFLKSRSEDSPFLLNSDYFKRVIRGEDTEDLHWLDGFRLLSDLPDAGGSDRRAEDDLPLRSLLESMIRSALPREEKEVAIALSGGVDSWVLAALVKEMGYRVHAYCLRSDIEGYCEWERASRFSQDQGIPITDIVTTPREFMDSLGEFVRRTEMPVYNLHPVSKLILARRLRERGISRVVTGDGADQVFRGETRCDLFPLTSRSFRVSGVRLICPFVSDRIASWVRFHGPFHKKEPILDLARSLSVPVPEKRPGCFPRMTVIEKPAYGFLSWVSDETERSRAECLALSLRLIQDFLKGEGISCVESVAS